MSAFSSTRKEDISLRLRAQNARNAKEETRKLELESQKMEDRLRDLKMAMNREKEERERRGGGFWQTGQTGTLNKYATEVLTAKPDKRSKESGKKRTLKVLKDTPLDIPERPARPGTMKFIAQQKVEASGKENRQRGPKCGQCENNPALLTCQQCCEYFCSDCFATFHMKGALRRHRSVSIQAAGPRQCMSPHPSLPSSARTEDSYQSYQEASMNGSAYISTNSSHVVYGNDSPEPEEQSVGGALLYGEFNEDESAASFQEAVMAFRSGGGVDGPSPSAYTSAASSAPSKTTVQVDSGMGTETVERQHTPEITFKEVNVGYLNRLMLKKYRRTDLAQMPSPGLGSATSSDSQLLPQSLSDEEVIEKRMPLLTEDALHALNMEVEECRKLKQKNSSQTSSGVSIIDLSDSLVPGVWKKSNCVVTEVDLFEAWTVNTGNEAGSESSTRNPSAVGSPSHYQHSRVEERGWDSPNYTTQHHSSAAAAAAQTSHHHGNRGAAQHREFLMEKDDFSLPNTNQSNATDRQQVSVNSRLPPTSKWRGGPREEGGDGLEREKSKIQNKIRPSRSPPSSSRAVKVHPPSSNKSRPPSAQKSRPGSRAWSRASMGEGILTKKPGDALKEISHRKMADVSSGYTSAFNEFFTLGVQPEPQERTLTPTKDKPMAAGLDNKRPGSASMKVSNKLYQMAPRSWRPDSSLSKTVPADTMQLPVTSTDHADGATSGSAEDDGSVVSYTYSGQLSGHPVDVRQGSMDLDGDEEELQIDYDDSEEEEEEVKPTLPPQPARGDFSPTRSSELTGSDLVAFAREASKLTRSSSGLGPRPRSTPRPLSGTRRTPSAYAEALSRQSFTRTPLAPLTPSPPPSDPPTSRRQYSGRSILQPGSPQTVLTVTSPRPPSSAYTRPPTARPESRAIVMDGEDLSKYDGVENEKHAQQDREDTETLDKLEWELASECGRITADGQISRLSQMEDVESFSSGSGTSSARITPQSTDLGFDINTKLRKDELEEDYSQYSDDKEEVRALP